MTENIPARTFVYKGKQLRTYRDEGEYYFFGTDIATLFGFSYPPTLLLAQYLTSPKKFVPYYVTAPGLHRRGLAFSLDDVKILASRSRNNNAAEIMEWIVKGVCRELDTALADQDLTLALGDEPVSQMLMADRLNQLRLLKEAKGLLPDEEIARLTRQIIGVEPVGVQEATPTPQTPDEVEEIEDVQPLYIKDFLRSKIDDEEVVWSITCHFSKFLKKMYVETHGHEPPQRTMNLHKEVRSVCQYTEKDRPLIEQAWARFTAKKG